MDDSHERGEDEHGDHDHHAHGDHDHHAHGDHHDHHAHDTDTVGVAVLTVSSSRTADDDPSGDRIVDAFDAAGHETVARELVDDDREQVREAVDRLVAREAVDAVVTTGGTGVTPDDVTPDAIEPRFEKPLPGFGELFRRLSYEEVGARTVGSRATAGIVDDTLVCCLPGSTNAVTLGVESVLLPAIGHLTGLATRRE